jgi:hypothetical protein
MRVRDEGACGCQGAQDFRPVAPGEGFRRGMASPGASAAFIVVREDDEVYSDAVEDRAKSVAAALNALEELEKSAATIKHR